MPKRIKPAGKPTRARGSGPSLVDETGDGDQAPDATASLQRAGFAIDEAGQARFVSRIQGRMYARVEAATRPEVLPAAGGALAGLGAWARFRVEDSVGTSVALTALAVHAAFALYLAIRSAGRRQKEGAPDPSAAWTDEKGELQPRLLPGEVILESAPADGKKGSFGRLVGGGFQALWGLLLAGLPLAAGGGAAPSPGLFAALSAGTVLGTALFGRGVRALIATKPATRLVLTDRRVVAIAGPGAAQSVNLDELRHRPLVLARQDGSATVALDVRPRITLRPIPMMGLFGLDATDPATAKRWAAAAVDARRALVEGSSPAEGPVETQQ